MWIVSFTNKCIDQQVGYLRFDNGTTFDRDKAWKYPKKIWADNDAQALRRGGWLYVEVIEVPR